MLLTHSIALGVPVFVCLFVCFQYTLPSSSKLCLLLFLAVRNIVCEIDGCVFICSVVPVVSIQESLYVQEQLWVMSHDSILFVLDPSQLFSVRDRCRVVKITRQADLGHSRYFLTLPWVFPPVRLSGHYYMCCCQGSDG